MASRTLYKFENGTMFVGERLPDFDGAYEHGSVFPWCGDTDVVKLVIVGKLQIEDISGFFSGLTNLKAVEGLENLQPRRDLSNMFMGCAALESLDLSTLNVPDLATAQNMFDGCTSLKALSLGNLHMDELRAAGGMFRNCKSLTSVEFPKSGLAELASLGDGPYRRHRCTIAPGLLKSHWERGLGAVLFATMFEIAQSVGYEQAEASIDMLNERSYGLCLKMGYEDCGFLPHAEKRPDGTYRNYHRLVKMLKPVTPLNKPDANHSSASCRPTTRFSDR